MFNLFFYFLLFNNFQPRYKLFSQVVRNLLAKIVDCVALHKLAYAKGSEGQLEGSEGQLEESEGLPEGSKGLL